MNKKKYDEDQLERVIVDSVKITKGIREDVCPGVKSKYEQYVPKELKEPVPCTVVLQGKKTKKEVDIITGVSKKAEKKILKSIKDKLGAIGDFF